MTALAAHPTELPPGGISRPVLEARVRRVRAWMTEAEVDALVVYGAPAVLGSRTNAAAYVRYLTGWMTTPAPAMVVLPVTGTATILTMGPHDTRMFELAAGWFGDVVATGGPNRYVDAVRAELTGAGRVATLGTAEMPAPLGRALDEALVGHATLAAEAVIDVMRLERDPEEVEMHRRAAEISDEMVAAAMRAAMMPGISGQELLAEVEHAGRRRGALNPGAWLAIGAAPVTTYSETPELAAVIGPHDRVQLGTSLMFHGHFAQTLRTGVSSQPSPRLRESAKILIELQDQALSVLRPGAMLHELVDVLEAGIDRCCPFERRSDPFRFRSCHGLGLSYNEPGMVRDLDPDRDRTGDGDGVRVAENMVFEIHPNFTLPDLGHVCAGDMAVVTADGAEWLTRFPRGLCEL